MGESALPAHPTGAAGEAPRAQARGCVAARGVAVALVPISGVAAGTVAFGWGPAVTPFGGLEPSTAAVRILAATAYVGWGTAWVAALAFALSTATEAPVGAVAGTIVMVIVVQVLDAIPALGTFRSWLPVHESLAWVGLLGPAADTGGLLRGVLLQVPYVVVLLGVAWYRFLRADITS